MSPDRSEKLPTSPPAEQRRRFVGWRMVGVAFVADFVSAGFLFYSFGVFFKALLDEFGGSRLLISLGQPLTQLANASIAVVVGRALDRFPVRRIMLLGATLTASGFVVASRVESLWQYYLVLAGMIAVGTSCMGGITSATLVANWFEQRRGTALGIATVGISFSGLVMPTIGTWLVASHGWRTTFVVYGAMAWLLVAPLVARTVVNRPEDLGLAPDGESHEDRARRDPPPERTWRSREILVSRSFWIICITFGLSLASVSALLTHLIPHATDLGIETYAAAALLSTAAAAGILGKFVFGALYDRVDPRVAVVVSLAAQLAGVACFLAATAYPGMLVGALVFGFGMGGVVPLQGALVGTAFGRRSYGKALGLMRPFQMPLVMVGSPLAGWVFDTTGGYDLAFLTFTCSTALAIGVVLALPARR